MVERWLEIERETIASTWCPDGHRYGLVNMDRALSRACRRIAELEADLEHWQRESELQIRHDAKRIAELEAACVRKNEDGAAAYEWGQHGKAEADELRGLLAECLALNPVVSGDMEKVRVWADVVRRMREAAGR